MVSESLLQYVSRRIHLPIRDDARMMCVFLRGKQTDVAQLESRGDESSPSKWFFGTKCDVNFYIRQFIRFGDTNVEAKIGDLLVGWFVRITSSRLTIVREIQGVQQEQKEAIYCGI